jgi:hypothetical protein
MAKIAKVTDLTKLEGDPGDDRDTCETGHGLILAAA